jgi:hypothetical protein
MIARPGRLACHWLLSLLALSFETPALAQTPVSKESKPSTPPAVATYPTTSNPEDAVRTFLTAMLIKDQPVLKQVVQETREFDWLTRAEAPPADLLEQMRTQFMGMPVKTLKPGDKVELPGGKSMVVATRDIGTSSAMIWPEGAPTPLRVKKVDGRWKVDASPIIAARKAADAARKKAESKK